MLYAAAWIVGEFSEHLSEARTTLDSLLNPKVTSLPAHIQAVFIQNIVKLYARFLIKAEAEVRGWAGGWVESRMESVCVCNRCGLPLCI